MIQQINKLMYLNQPLKAWDLVKDSTDQILKEKVYAKVCHAFNEEAYLKYYKEALPEYPFPKKFAYSCDRLYFRFSWLIDKLLKINPRSVLDIGCADGYLGLTLAMLEISSVGLNLFAPSIVLAEERAKEKNIDNLAKFQVANFFDYQTTHEVVVLFDILEHLPDPVKGLAKAFSLVKDGGMLYISTPREDSKAIHKEVITDGIGTWDDNQPAGHLRLFTQPELNELITPYQVGDFTIDSTGNMLVEIGKPWEPQS